LAQILIVDDEQELRQLMCAWLQRAGHEVLEASNGRQAVRALSAAAQHVDLVITDIYMPEVDGLELVTHCKNQDVRVIAISGGHPRIQLDVLDLAKAMGALTILQKPFDREGLMKAVEIALE
jgi:DNA-binding NtrC family response regulator